jgi:hypothetical protein
MEPASLLPNTEATQELERAVGAALRGRPLLWTTGSRGATDCNPAMAEVDELKVFISNRDSTCDECHENLGRKAWITLTREKGALCLTCGDLDHLVFLPSGDAALTRRARKHSTLSAVVLKWSRTRKRYERQGLLVEEQALNTAEEECLADEDVRIRHRERDALRRLEMDQQYVEVFASRVRELFPACPKGREFKIAEHACLK